MDVVAATSSICNFLIYGFNYGFNYKSLQDFRILIIMNRVLVVGVLVSYH